MAKGRKAQIKKMIEELHAKRETADGQKNRAQDQGSGGAGFKGPKKSGTYRPKI